MDESDNICKCNENIHALDKQTCNLISTATITHTTIIITYNTTITTITIIIIIIITAAVTSLYRTCLHPPLQLYTRTAASILTRIRNFAIKCQK
jgi:hypothetical protein